MIKVKLTKNNNYYKRIIITGHANYDDFGKDIVCAAVSSTVITSVNSSLAIDNESISYEDKNGLDIKVLKDDEVTTKIINVMITNLYELEKAYPKNIKIKEENNE
ncbi:MAG: ribosomal-processing cysteine protease Prp [Bacilli bacterium]|nr:ribosomal-processing cysteine protease Prp [Bacilli bacterium]